MTPSKKLRLVPRHSGVIRLLRRPTSREWLLQLADTDDHRRDPDETDTLILRRLNRALAAPGDPRRS